MVIMPHEGAAKPGEWDGPAMRALVRSPENPEYFRRIFAFLDEGKDENVKSSYRFIHHFVGENGDAGPPSETACRTGIAVLNGARGGTTLRGDDRAGVYEHLARHLREAGIEPPELASAEAMGRLSRRVGGATLEIREGLRLAAVPIAARAAGALLTGYASVYDSPSVDFGGWREIVARGAFDESLSEKNSRPIKAFWNHNSDIVLGSTDAGTLHLESDHRGLLVSIEPPASAAQYVESIQRGDVSQMSIGFIVREQEWVEEKSGSLLRIIRNIDLWEVSPVAFPAYPSTSITASREGRSTDYGLLRAKLRLLQLDNQEGI